MSGIEWTDVTWNPIVGCDIVSPGCTNCYAMKMAARLEAVSVAHERDHAGDPGPLQHYQGTVRDTRAGPVWTGKVGRAGERKFAEPPRWTKPRVVFVNSMGDLFHEAIPDAWIDQVFAVMALAPQHVFIVLTKRPDRMRKYLTARNGMGNADLCKAINDIPGRLGNRHGALSMPLPNVILGVSAEDQARADERIPLLLDTPAACRMVSCEPLLGPLSIIDEISGLCAPCDDPLTVCHSIRTESTGARCCVECNHDRRLDWIIAGGESGPGARPMHPDWARSLRDQCAADGVPFFFKQWGEWGPDDGPCDRQGLSRDPIWDGTARCAWLKAPGLWRFGKDVYEACRSHEACAAGEWVFRVGKKAAGRTLDGVTHDGVPEPIAGLLARRAAA